MIHEPKWKKPSLYVALALLGLGLEAAVLVLARQWELRFSYDSLLMGPMLFAAIMAYVYLSAQLLDSRFHVGVVPGMSLALLAGMVAWIVGAAAVGFLCFLVVMAIAGIVGTVYKLACDVGGKVLRGPRKPSA